MALPNRLKMITHQWCKCQVISTWHRHCFGFLQGHLKETQREDSWLQIQQLRKKTHRDQGPWILLHACLVVILLQIEQTTNSWLRKGPDPIGSAAVVWALAPLLGHPHPVAGTELQPCELQEAKKPSAIPHVFSSQQQQPHLFKKCGQLVLSLAKQY